MSLHDNLPESLLEPDLPHETVIEQVARLLASGEPDIYERVTREVTQLLLYKAMRYCRGNHEQAARCLGLSRLALRTKLRMLALLERNGEVRI